MPNDYAIVELANETISSIPLDSISSVKVKIIEECDIEHVNEKIKYWSRIYNYHSYESEELKYHFYNKKRNLHLWTNKPCIKYTRHWREYKAV